MAEFAGKGLAGAALGTGVAGLSLGVLNGGLGNLLGGLGNGCGMGWNGRACGCSEDHIVNRYELAQENTINDLRSQLALRDSTIFTDQKSLELYKYIDTQLRDIRDALSAQAVHNQRTEDSFVLARQDIAAVKNELSGAIAMEAERRCCGDNSIVTYANATFYPKLVADVTAGTTTTAQTTYNPIPKCGCCCGNG